MASSAAEVARFPTISHIALKSEWEAQKDGEWYSPSMYNASNPDDFVHCTQMDRTQLAGVLTRFFKDESVELVFLFLDRERITHKVVDEETPDGFFPHIYGPINKSCIYAVAPVDRARVF